MGWNAVISANVKVARTEEEKKKLEELCQKYKDESDFLLDDYLKTYNVRTKQKVYIPNERKNYILRQNKDFYYFDLDEREINCKKEVWWILDSLGSFYNIGAYSYLYEEIHLNDMKKIIDNMELDEEDYEEGEEKIKEYDKENLEYFKKSMKKYIEDIFETLKRVKIKDNEILDFTFSIRLV